MSDSANFGFARLVPGFDFLQNLAKGSSQGMPQMPNLSNWVAPTLSVEELDKRIGELKAVHFWLDQNGKALGATIQALEVQKMTLATLQGMNFSMGELANALKVKTPQAPAATPHKAREPAAAATGKVDAASGAASEPAGAKQAEKKTGGASPGAAPVDPLQWWSALTQQFQQIATDAMKDVANNVDATRTAAASAGRQPAKAATGKTDTSAAAPRPAPAAKKAPRKRAAKKST